MKQIAQFSFSLLTAFVFAAAFNSAIAQCDPPNSLGAHNMNGTSAILSWNSVAGVTVYKVQVEDGGGYGTPDFFWETTVSGTMTQVTGLSPGDNFKFRVRSKCGNSLSPWSAYVFFNSGAVGPACSTPTGLGTQSVSSSSATLVWDRVMEATSYTVHVENVTGTSFNYTTTVMDNNAMITGLSSHTTYKFKVQANCSSGQSAWSQRVNFTTGGY